MQIAIEPPSSTTPSKTNPSSVLKRGHFVRVRFDHEDISRAGKDGLVMDVDDDTIGLVFDFDRANKPQNTICVGIEQWDIAELDLRTAEA